MAKPLVHVLVVNWNGREHLHACFESLQEQTYDNFTVILLDNASTDDSVAFVKRHFEQPDRGPRVEVLQLETNRGWSGANNAGIDASLRRGADFVFLLNNDTAIAPDAIDLLVQFAEKHPKAGAIAPKMLLFDQPWLINSVGISCTEIASAWDEGLGRADGPRWSEPKQVLGVCGGAMFLRADALREAGLLPQEFEIYLDDLDLCLRMWDFGYECWSCPSATVRHKFSATMGQGARAHRKYYLNTRNRLRVMLRNFPARKLGGALARYAAGEVRSIARAVLSGEPWKIAAHAKSWIAAIAYLSRAISQRRATKRRGTRAGHFWKLIRTDCDFFPGVSLPANGWYPSLTGNRAPLRPISTRAMIDVTAGELLVTHANCYPWLGRTDVEVLLNGRSIARLRADREAKPERLTVEAGTLEFVSRHVFEAEATGAAYDIGGWVALHQQGIPGTEMGHAINGNQ